MRRAPMRAAFRKSFARPDRHNWPADVGTQSWPTGRRPVQGRAWSRRTSGGTSAAFGGSKDDTGGLKWRAFKRLGRAMGALRTITS